MKHKSAFLSPALIRLLVLICTAAAQTCVLAQASSQDERVSPVSEQMTDLGISWGVEFDWNPRYVWRGITYTQGPVLQTSVWATTRGFTYSLWSNTNLDSADGRGTDEVDLGMSSEREWGAITLEPALWIYTFPGQEDAPTTTEVSIGLSAPVGSLQLVSNHYCEVLESPGAYFGDVGVLLQKSIGDGTEVEVGASLGWGSRKFNEANIGVRTSAMNLFTIEMSATCSMSESAYMRPHLSFARVLDDRLRRQLDDTDIVNLGIAVGMEF